MLIGILSDSHGQHLAVRQAMAVFDRLGVAHIVHCGDIGGTSVFDELVGRACTFVWGNMDDPTGGVAEYPRSVGIPLPITVPTMLELAGKKLAVFHGHEHAFRQDLGEHTVDYILHGHTHVTRDRRIGRTRIINPGALHRAQPKTVATLDLSIDKLTFHEISQ